ncbi:MAG: hypothetical protein ABIR98_13770 [Usitatibacter sp.]
MAIFIAVLALALAGGLVLLVQAASLSSARRDHVSERALAQAREALLAFASDRPITAVVGPGFLPCPDLDDDGWAESTCGSLAGDRGQEERLGRLPWKTLGLPDLRDGHGERLWYAVSTRYKGLLNCAASAACVDLSPATGLGTITVRDNSGRVLHDGTLADADRGGAAAVIIAPGAPLTRQSPAGSREQHRDCAPGDCNTHGQCVTKPPSRAARCDPGNYLDLAPPERSGEDNADFHDRSDAGRVLNGNGFIQGPVVDARGRVAVNDRLAVVAYTDVMPRVARRVGLELAQCLAFFASRPENAGRLPRASPACPGVGTAGRIPDTPFDTAPGMLTRWWRAEPRRPEVLTELPTQAQACNIAVPPADAGQTRTLAAGNPSDEGATAGVDDLSWWRTWKPFVLYVPAADLEVVDAEGHLLAANRRAAIVVGMRRDECETPRLACDASSCTRVTSAPLPGRVHDAVIALP